MQHENSGWEPVVEPDDGAVQRRLEELGVPPIVLPTAVRIGQNQGDFVTPAYPRTARGLIVWMETVHSLRGQLTASGEWRLNDTDNIPRVISEAGVAIAVNSGNEFTGLRGQAKTVSTRSPRGPGSLRIVMQNMQFDLPIPQMPLLRRIERTWFLLYFRDGNIVRSELSLARAVNHEGQLVNWAERLILPDIDLHGPDSATDDFNAPDMDVRVLRR